MGGSSKFEAANQAAALVEKAATAVASLYPTVSGNRIKDLENHCQRIASEAYNSGNGKFNVLVYKNGFNCDMTRLRNVSKRFKTSGPWNTSYWVHLMPKGSKNIFVKFNDGGYSNWCFLGKFTRNNDEVTFS